MADPILTDDELAEIEVAYPQDAPCGWTISRLIAALRASREEVERLRLCLEPGKANAIVAAMFDQAQRLGHDPFSSKHALTYLVEEVERLRGRMTEWALAMRSHEDTYARVPQVVWVDAGDFLRLESGDPSLYHQSCGPECGDSPVNGG